MALENVTRETAKVTSLLPRINQLRVSRRIRTPEQDIADEVMVQFLARMERLSRRERMQVVDGGFDGDAA